MGSDSQSFYVLKFFGNTVSSSRRRYREDAPKGVRQNRRPELTGGGLVGSAGGWSAVKTLRRSGFRQKADERILGDGDFVSTVLQQAGEQMERKYQLKTRGYDIEKVVERFAKLLQMEPAEILSKSESRQAVRARNLVCYWSYNELGISRIELAQTLRVSQPAVSAAVRKGETLVGVNGYALLGSNKL